MKTYKFGLLGAGKMGSSILKGILTAGIFKEEEVLIFDKYPNKELFPNVDFASDEMDLMKKSKMVLLAVKPQVFPSVMETIKKERESLSVELVLSIMAGISIATIKEAFGEKKYVRIMPNTPALIGCAASALARSENVSDDDFQIVEDIFNSIGIAKEIPESQMDIVIPVNGSMPAYLYLFAKTFIDDAVAAGMEFETAKMLCTNAIIGSAKMIQNTDRPIDALIKDVCSPGGTTLAGLDELYKGNFEETIRNCNHACVARSIELGKSK